MTTHTSEASREAIAAAARELFTVNGYTATSVRAIARDAGVDPALVMRYFGSKEGLFLKVMQSIIEARVDLTGPRETLGMQIATTFLGGDREKSSNTYYILMQTSESDQVRSELHKIHREYTVLPIARCLRGRATDIRAHVIASILVGAMTSITMLGDERLSALETEQLVRTYAPIIQRIVNYE